MLYVVTDKLMAQLKAFLGAEVQENKSARTLLLQELALTEADPILSCLLWTRMDLIAEFRVLMQGTNPHDTDGTFFDKTMPFSDPFRERLANEMAGSGDEFCLGSRNDVAADIALAAAETIIDAVRQGLEAQDIDIYSSQLASVSLMTDYFVDLPLEVVVKGFQDCVHHVADKIRLDLLVPTSIESY